MAVVVFEHLGLVAGVLRDSGLVDMTPEAMVEEGVTAAFFPHGLGHQIGRTAHDGAGLLCPPWERYGDLPGLEVEAGQCYTIEPRLPIEGHGIATCEEIVAVTIPQRRGEPLAVDSDEHPRPGSTLDGLAKLKPIVRDGGTITAGNASGINDGACALLLASGDAAAREGLEPLARVVAWAVAGVEPRIIGIGPVPASRRVLSIAGLDVSRMDVIELNEAFAAQGLASLRQLGVDDDAEHVNPNGGAIALGHPLGMSGARLVTTAAYELRRRNGRYALCTMCIGVGQGIAMIIERA